MDVIVSMDALTNRYDAVFCDVWGVVHNGRSAFADACTALTRFREAGKHVVMLTNIPKPRGPIPGQFDRLGVPRSAWDVIVTSGDAIRAELAARAPGPMYKIGPAHDHTLWEGLGLAQAPLTDATFVAISGLNSDDETPQDYAEVLQQAHARDLELLSANPDIVVRHGDKLVWCAGAIARDYEALGGRVVMAGKPHAPIYALAYRELESVAGRAVDKARILCIGDGPGTDVAGANAQGLDCLFIAAGIHGESLWSDGRLDPAKAEQTLAAEKVRAKFVMSALR
ncbi:MAG: TIGR01459 family HAD-type hydrolase [Proteobacteria bacterium]|nr:TIGR01459 family HAD-type hydrolase [Pseudomonadota bacterium]